MSDDAVDSKWTSIDLSTPLALIFQRKVGSDTRTIQKRIKEGRETSMRDTIVASRAG